MPYFCYQKNNNQCIILNKVVVTIQLREASLDTLCVLLEASSLLSCFSICHPMTLNLVSPLKLISFSQADKSTGWSAGFGCEATLLSVTCNS